MFSIEGHVNQALFLVCRKLFPQGAQSNRLKFKAFSAWGPIFLEFLQIRAISSL
jgi:hypothetical protein